MQDSDTDSLSLLALRLTASKSVVRCHIFDPGMLNTRYTRKASGLGHTKMWHVWKAKR